MEQASKFFLQSKTILGLALTAFVTFAPYLGLSFGQDDANLVSANIDKIIEAVGILLATWGRVTASGPLALK